MSKRGEMWSMQNRQKAVILFKKGIIIADTPFHLDLSICSVYVQYIKEQPLF